jgi:hypothetical protein
MTSGVFIPFEVLPGFSAAFRAELSRYVQAQIGLDGEPAPEEVGGPAELSVAQARTFLDRVSDKVRTAVRVMAEGDTPSFAMANIMAALDIDEPGALRGVWSGITKRVRTVLGDPDAYLIWWDEQPSGWVGRVSPTTHRALRKVLSL